MYQIKLDAPDDFEGWRAAARRLARADVPPERIIWSVETAGSGSADDLFAEAFSGAGRPDMDGSESADAAPFAISRAFLDLAQTALLHSDPARFALLYMLLLRTRRAPHALHDKADPLVRRVEALAQAVRRDKHKMRAFVRFREIGNGDDAERHFVAWFEPDHHIVRANAGFFVRRFPNMRWSILTPATSIHWADGILREGPGANRSDAPDGDPVEDLWKGYYSAIFNPARLKVGAMLSEMPKKYWRNLPEAALIPALIAGAQAREAAMIAAAPRKERLSQERMSR
ncbi:DNA metabolism protein [Sphingobium algorifonticola]|uniref:DNA metabolism protein n=1 Tax=Sphingobium algorifonticola TaxID=2008318 RepID=A0A437J8G2_9SPHN|nr:DNA metabolism protein [Sphingobium algorifonticola]